MIDSGSRDGFEPLSDIDLIPIETEVGALDGEVVKQISEGDILKVALQLAEDATVVVVMHNGKVAGKVVAPEARRLPEYIIRGTDYRATLLSKGDGRLRVQIKAIE